MLENVTLFPYFIGASPTQAEVKQAVDWQHREVTVYGKKHLQPRLTCWYGAVPYVYSGLRWEARSLPPILESLRERIEKATGYRFNSVLCNLYRDGSDTVGWHSDNEPLFGDDPTVASLSFGATRKFQFKPKKGKKSAIVNYDLTHGSLLLMGKGVQRDWLHTLPRTALPTEERINLTFRLTV